MKKYNLIENNSGERRNPLKGYYERYFEKLKARTTGLYAFTIVFLFTLVMFIIESFTKENLPNVHKGVLFMFLGLSLLFGAQKYIYNAPLTRKAEGKFSLSKKVYIFGMLSFIFLFWGTSYLSRSILMEYPSFRDNLFAALKGSLAMISALNYIMTSRDAVIDFIEIYERTKVEFGYKLISMQDLQTFSKRMQKYALAQLGSMFVLMYFGNSIETYESLINTIYAFVKNYFYYTLSTIFV